MQKRWAEKKLYIVSLMKIHYSLGIFWNSVPSHSEKFYLVRKSTMAFTLQLLFGPKLRFLILADFIQSGYYNIISKLLCYDHTSLKRKLASSAKKILNKTLLLKEYDWNNTKNWFNFWHTKAASLIYLMNFAGFFLLK